MSKTAIDFAVNTYAETNAIPSRLASTLFGIPISQTWADLMLWERFLNAAQPAHLIELGTGRGGLSLYLALQCANRGIRFATVDTFNWTEMAGPLFALANIRYVQGDIFESGKALVEEALRIGGAVTVFCDGGDKPREFREFAPLLRPGDYIAAHDWGNEITAGDVERFPVWMWDSGVCASVDSITRWFRVGVQ